MKITINANTRIDVFKQLSEVGIRPATTANSPNSPNSAQLAEVRLITRGYFMPAKNKIPAIKFVRIMLGFGLKEAKNFVEEDCEWDSYPSEFF